MHGEEKIIPYYSELRTKLAENFKPEEILEIDKAYDIAKKAHDEQMRKSG